MKIDNFHAPGFEFLSNFYTCPVRYEGILYPSSEHAFQAAKTLDFKVRKIFTLPGMTAAMSKHLGKAIVIRPGWDHIKLKVMEEILIAKFSDFQLKKWLIETGDAELVEGNTWNDTFWGVCNGKGTNHLGRLLMELRENARSKNTIDL